MTATFNRGWVIVSAVIAGLLVGLFAGFYIYYAWVPADMVLRDSPPRTLAFNGQTPQYRDIYVARVANRFQALGGATSSQALQDARDLLGVTTGDATNEEAINMARGGADVARIENQTDGNAGRFTQNDEFAMTLLADTLQTAPPYLQQDVRNSAPAVARTQSRIIGFLLVALLAVLVFSAVYLIDRRIGKQYIAIAQNQRAKYAPVPPDDQTSPTGAAVVAAGASTQTPASAAAPTVAAAAVVGMAAASPASSEVPLATFPPCTYAFGDDRFDEDFTIAGPMGELLGECGASIAERLGLDSPARVTALAVWVFDKNDFQSTTKVLMTDYAYNDSTIRTKLTARGEPVLAVDNGVIEVQTSMLRVEIRVTGLQLNTDSSPANSYFQKVTLSFVVYRRQQL